MWDVAKHPPTSSGASRLDVPRGAETEACVPREECSARWRRPIGAGFSRHPPRCHSHRLGPSPRCRRCGRCSARERSSLAGCALRPAHRCIETYARCVRSTIPRNSGIFFFRRRVGVEFYLTLPYIPLYAHWRVACWYEDMAQDKAQTGSQPGEHSISSEGVELNRVRRARAGATSAKAAASLQYGLKHGW